MDFRSLFVFLGAIFLNMLVLGEIGSAIVGLTGLMAFVAIPGAISKMCKNNPMTSYLVFTFFAALFAIGGSAVVAFLVIAGLGMGMTAVSMTSILLFFLFYFGLMYYVFPRFIAPKL